MPNITTGKIIRQAASVFLLMYAIALTAAAWATMVVSSAFEGESRFAYPTLAVLAAVLCGLSSWWLNAQKAHPEAGHPGKMLQLGDHHRRGHDESER